MTLDDITASIKAVDLDQIRDAFDALVDWPSGEPVRARDLASLTAAMLPVCRALASDRMLMPREVRLHVNTLAPDQPLGLEASYADGAARVGDQWRAWARQVEAAAAASPLLG